jgi:hypothetical protein
VAQHQVPRVVAERVVELFEAVEVGHEQRGGRLLLHRKCGQLG